MSKHKPTTGRTRRTRAGHRESLVAALVLVCRKIRRLQPSPAARAACDDVSRWLRAMPPPASRQRAGPRK